MRGVDEDLLHIAKVVKTVLNAENSDPDPNVGPLMPLPVRSAIPVLAGKVVALLSATGRFVLPTAVDVLRPDLARDPLDDPSTINRQPPYAA